MIKLYSIILFFMIIGSSFGIEPNSGGFGNYTVEKTPWDYGYVVQSRYGIITLMGIENPKPTTPRVKNIETVPAHVYAGHCEICNGENEYIVGLNQIWLKPDSTILDMLVELTKFIQYSSGRVSNTQLDSTWAVMEREFIATEYADDGRTQLH